MGETPRGTVAVGPPGVAVPPVVVVDAVELPVTEALEPPPSRLHAPRTIRQPILTMSNRKRFDADIGPSPFLKNNMGMQYHLVVILRNGERG